MRARHWSWSPTRCGCWPIATAARPERPARRRGETGKGRADELQEYLGLVHPESDPAARHVLRSDRGGNRLLPHDGGAERSRHRFSGGDRHHRAAGRRNHRTRNAGRTEEHTSELQSLMRISYDVFCWKKKNNKKKNIRTMKAQ